MKTYDFELVYFADPRFPGGTSTSIVNELKALQHAKICPGFYPVLSAVFPNPKEFNSGLDEIMQGNQVHLLSPNLDVSTRIALVHHPRLFEELPFEQIRVRVEHLVLVLHHPPFNGTGTPEYDLKKIIQNLREMFCTKVLIAPVGPMVRKQLIGQLPDGAELLEDDWHNLLDFDDWAFRAAPTGNKQIEVGRHSRPQLSKWPETHAEAVQIYPDRPDVRVNMLGAPADLKTHFDPIPSNWNLLNYDSIDVPLFLQGLDFYVYFHSRRWVEAFGYCILEAIAKGVPAILPEHFKPLFGPAALYASADTVWDTIENLWNDDDAYMRHANQARRHVEKTFSTDRFIPRLIKLGLNTSTKSPRKPAVAKPERRVMMMTSNGVGLGHLTRVMAVMEHFPETTKSALFTLSQGFKLAVERGILTQFTPFHRLTGADVPNWNAALAEELRDFIALFRPDTLVFDGNVPYSGLMAALDVHPEIKRVWLRRALWAGNNDDPIDRAEDFDLIIEPEEISGRFDTGPTRYNSEGVVVVPPILNIAPKDRLSRKEARNFLEIEPDKIAIGLMLGAGNNFEFSHIRKLILGSLAKHKDVDVIEIVPPIRQSELVNEFENCRRLELYPAYRYSRGFDGMITGAGYNTFHENLLGAVPTVFVPNEAAEMDRQILRARHASIIGCGQMIRAGDRIGIDAQIQRFLDTAVRKQMKHRMSRLEFGDGAAVAAGLIDRLSYAVRANRQL